MGSSAKLINPRLADRSGEWNNPHTIALSNNNNGGNIINGVGVNMSEFEKQRVTVISQLKGLCAHCANDVRHNCKLQKIVSEVATLSGVPLIVNNQFNGLLIHN